MVAFPGSSAGKESSCNAGDPSSISGLGVSAGEEIGSPLQYFWASLVAQTVKNPPAMGKTCVWSLGQEDPLEKGKATHSSILAWRIPWTEEPGRLQSTELQSWTRLRDFHLWLLDNAVLVSKVQQNESATHTHISPPFWTSVPFRSPQCIQQSPLCYTVCTH